jgi:hypothetical protein
MEVLGYSKLPAPLAPQVMIAEVETSLRRQDNIRSDPVTYGRGDRNACEDFLKFGTNDEDVILRMLKYRRRLTTIEVEQES